MSRDKRLERAQLRVLFNVPFFAAGVARLPVIWDSSIPTACTNGEHIRWNPEWFDKCKDDELVTVYCEEVGHCLLGHLWRMPTGGDHLIWNIACDCAVRNMMEEFGQLQTSRGQPDPFPFPDKQLLFPHAAYKDMSEEKVYSLLIQNAIKVTIKMPGGGGGSGKGKPSPFAEFEIPKGGGASSPQQQKLNNGWQSTMIQSAHMAKSRGTVPLGIERLITELLSPQVSWQEILRNLLRELCNDDWNWMKPDLMLSDSTGFILPSLESERMGPVVFAIDTSGSINHDLLKAFKTEEQSCLDDMKPSSLLEICCDAAIHRVKEYKRGESIDGSAPGGGGTSFVPVWDYIKKMRTHPKCVVYLTDLDGDFGKDPEVPIIWVTWTKGGTAPFGQVVVV